MPAAFYVRQFNAHVERQRREREENGQPPPGTFPCGFFPTELIKKLLREGKQAAKRRRQQQQMQQLTQQQLQPQDELPRVLSADLRFFFENIDTNAKGELVMRRSWPWHPPTTDLRALPTIRSRHEARFFLRPNPTGAPKYGMHGELYVAAADIAPVARNMVAWMLQHRLFDAAQFKKTARAKLFKTVSYMFAHQLMDFCRCSRLLRGQPWIPACTHMRPVVLHKNKRTGAYTLCVWGV